DRRRRQPATLHGPVLPGLDREPPAHPRTDRSADPTARAPEPARRGRPLAAAAALPHRGLDAAGRPRRRRDHAAVRAARRASQQPEDRPSATGREALLPRDRPAASAAAAASGPAPQALGRAAPAPSAAQPDPGPGAAAAVPRP